MLIKQLLHSHIGREVCDEIMSKKPSTFKEAYEIAHALESTRHTPDGVKSNAQLNVKSNTRGPRF